MKHSTLISGFGCLAIVAACNSTPSGTAQYAGGVPQRVGSGQAPSLEFAPGTGPTPLQYAALNLDALEAQYAQKTPERSSSPARQEARKDAASAAENELHFLQHAGNDMQSEEQAALYVASKTTNSDVRDYAALVGRELGKANLTLRKLAVNRGMEIPPDPVGQLRAELDDLRQMSGTQMDRAYLNKFGVQALMDIITLFEDQQAQSKDKEVQKFIADLLPRLRKYHQQGKRLQEKYTPVMATLEA